MIAKKSIVLCSAFILLFGLASVACAQDDAGQAETEAETTEAGAMDTNREKASYAIGLNMGRNFATQDVDVDADLLIRGLRDGLAEAEPALPDEELQAAMQAFQQEVMAAQQALREEQAAANIEEAQQFLEENKQKEGVQVTESGLQYQVLEEGSGASPTADDTVVVHYKGMVPDGTVFDSSYDRGQPATFPLAGVIPGFREGIQLMQVGGKYKLFIPPELGYGERGAGQDIPPNSALIFEIELVGVNPAQGGEGAGQGGN